jgi:TRAP-type C4-dicarboxylate transport system permease small subunit
MSRESNMSISEVSSDMSLPMWIMYLATVLGFGLASIRTAQEIVNNIKNFNVKAETTLEATLKEAKEEVETSGVNLGGEE